MRLDLPYEQPRQRPDAPTAPPLEPSPVERWREHLAERAAENRGPRVAPKRRAKNVSQQRPRAAKSRSVVDERSVERRPRRNDIPNQMVGVSLRDEEHREKIARMAWATEDAKHYLSAPDGEYLEVEAPTFPSRNDSMYVNLRDDKVISPSDVIDRDDAEGIIHTVNVALQRIVEVTEFWGHQIGTKGFMK